MKTLRRMGILGAGLLGFLTLAGGAAAVTSVEMKATSISQPADYFSFVADRPFFFVIRDDATGTILFMGSLYDPLF